MPGQHLPRFLPGELSLVDDEFPVDQDIVDSLSILMWLEERGGVFNCFWVKNHDVGVESFADHTPVAES